jgi:manganese/zinc/iron transport system substrate-binding protein
LYHRNADAYHRELDGLHAEVKDLLAKVPKEQRVLVTSHDAFRYFGRAYDVEVRGLQGISTADEAGLREVRQIVNLVKDRKIKALFPETSVSADGIKKVIQECRGDGHEVRLAPHELFSDSMGPPGSPGGDYAGMIRANAKLIAESLQ